MALGPLQFVVIGFDGPSFDGFIIDELAAVRTQGFVRLVDALGVHKDDEGAVWSIEIDNLAEDVTHLTGAAIGALLGLGAGYGDFDQLGVIDGTTTTPEYSAFGIPPGNIAFIADQIPIGGAALLMLVEHIWLVPLRDAIRIQGGILIADEFLNAETMLCIGAELPELEDASAH